jgi:phenylpropionate dioxygenase-like ring-hydroxylating dioxygenase large terminal subunit
LLAFADEIGGALLKRTILDRPLVLFRTAAGTPVALEDRCVHRSFPLSSGALDNDTVVCGYHGLRYDARGTVIEVPSQARCPKGVGVRSYALHETGPLVWAWMGEPDVADPATIPAPAWLTSPDWVARAGYFALDCNYVSLHENLLDLTHLSFLHAKSFGTPDYASAPYEVTIEDGYYALLRRVVPTTLPPVWAKPTGLEGHANAARITRSEFLSPGLHVVTATFYDNALPAETRPEFTISTCHIPTPETPGSTHYFIVNARSFALDQAWMTDFMHDQLFTAFQEDVTGLETLQRTLVHEDARDDFFEISLAADRPSIEMRQYLKRRADAETLHPADSVAARAPAGSVLHLQTARS